MEDNEVKKAIFDLAEAFDFNQACRVMLDCIGKHMVLQTEETKVTVAHMCTVLISVYDKEEHGGDLSDMKKYIKKMDKLDELFDLNDHGGID